jgi:hypothetical protein
LVLPAALTAAGFSTFGGVGEQPPTATEKLIKAIRAMRVPVFPDISQIPPCL